MFDDPPAEEYCWLCSEGSGLLYFFSCSIWRGGGKGVHGGEWVVAYRPAG